jgi:hypothetical protein
LYLYYTTKRCYCQAFEESFFDIWEEIFLKKWLILLDKMFEVWYNIKIGRARPCPSRKKSPTRAQVGVVVLDLPSLSHTVEQNYQTLP